VFISAKLKRLFSLGCVCGLLLIGLASGVIESSPNDPCYFRESGYEVQGIDATGTWFGAKGYNYVRDPYVFPGSWLVRSVWVHDPDGGDYVEMGWCKGVACCVAGGNCENEPPHFFAAWVRAGLYGETVLGPATPFTTHKFSVVSQWGNWWRWWLDGRENFATWNTFHDGTAGGQSEVHNTCESAYTRWWDLQHYSPWLEWDHWYNLQEALDDNPNYHFEGISNTEFKVVHD